MAASAITTPNSAARTTPNAGLKTLNPYFWRYRWGMVFSAFSVLAMNAIALQSPIVLWKATDDLTASVTLQKMSHYALLLLAIAFGSAVFRFLTRWKLIGISRDIEYDLRNDLFTHLETLSHSFYQRNRTGDIMAKATNDLTAVRNLLGPAIMYSANTIVFTVGALIYMWRISPRLTVYTFVPLPLASITIQYFGRKIHERFERIQAMFSDISAMVQENFSGARIIRAFAQEQAQIKEFEGANQEYIHRSLFLVRLMGMLWPSLELLLGIAIVLVLWLGGREVVLHNMDPHKGITLGAFVAFQFFMLLLTWPIIALGYVINLFQRGRASMERINDLFSEHTDVVDESTADARELSVEGAVELRNLNFSYNGTPVLKNVNLRVAAGSSLAIVGPTGSGKTTLVNLIPRLYDATPGTVLLDGRPIREYPLAQLRESIGFVPQETFLFSDSIRENITFGAEEATEEDVRRAAEGASIARDIEDFPEKYDTLVGERGITLSGGQKQRTAIARAIIRNPRILVLDDALSSVDTYTEEKILNHLREVMKGRTTIFISHRVSTVRNADRIAVLHGGEIVEYGTHDELISRDGYYTDLYNKQLLEEELAEVG